MRPRSPYGVAKLAAHGLVGTLRAHHGRFLVSAITYNHESPRRPERFLPRKVSAGVAAIAAGRAETLTLGDLARCARLVARARRRGWDGARAAPRRAGRLRLRLRRRAHGRRPGRRGVRGGRRRAHAARRPRPRRGRPALRAPARAVAAGRRPVARSRACSAGSRRPRSSSSSREMVEADLARLDDGRAVTVRVALNLVFLVPGETGGMEVYARELLPRLAAIDGLEPVAIVNRVAAEDRDAPWSAGRARPSSRRSTRATASSGCGASSATCRGSRGEVGADLVHSLASTGPARWAGGPPRVTTVHDLHYAVVPDAHFGLRGLGMRLLVPAAVKASRRVIADSQATKDDVVRVIGFPAERIDVVHLATTLPPADAPATPEAELRARLRAGRAADPAQPRGEAPAQERRGTDRRARRDPGRAAARARRARLRDGARGGAAGARRGGRRRRRRCASPAGCRAQTSRACGAPARRTSSRPSTRASDCRCSRRWRAACPALARTARRCPRSRATPRCCSTRAIRPRSAPRSSGCSATRRCASGCAPPASRAPRSSRGSAARARRPTAYERALATD